MDRRKTLINEYKQAKVVGGVYRLVNTRTGMYLLAYTPNLQAKQNGFNFAISTGTCLDLRLKEEWGLFGGEVFTFEILEALEKKKEQTQDEFVGDLKMLSQLWGEKLDSLKRY